MNVIDLPDRALTGDFGTRLLSRFGCNVCTATPSRSAEALAGLIPLALCRSSGVWGGNKSR
jgi:hypothetical protein